MMLSWLSCSPAAQRTLNASTPSAHTHHMDDTKPRTGFLDSYFHTHRVVVDDVWFFRGSPTQLGLLTAMTSAFRLSSNMLCSTVPTEVQVCCQPIVKCI